MKKVILSLVMVATLSFVSCKDEAAADAPVEDVVEEVVAPVEAAVDTAAAAVDTAAAAVTPAPAQ
jgi:PBP1b-binding outer membrane lipoprotein LpoB